MKPTKGKMPAFMMKAMADKKAPAKGKKAKGAKGAKAYAAGGKVKKGMKGC